MSAYTIDLELDFDEPKKGYEALYTIVKTIRGAGGCPWDQEQTPYTLRSNLVEEACESVSAIEEAGLPTMDSIWNQTKIES